MASALLLGALAQSYIPVDGDDGAEFRNLPQLVNPNFIVPPALQPVDLPSEPTDLHIEVGETGKRFSYWYMPDDTVSDIFMMIAERTQTPVHDILGLRVIKMGAIVRSYVDVPFSLTNKIKDVPLMAGDDLEVTLRSMDNVKVNLSPVASDPQEIPGFFLVKVKLAGMKMFTVPVPRLARGTVFRGIVEDRAALFSFSVELRRNTRDGPIVQDGDVLTESDKFFWATLVEKKSVSAVPEEDICESGQTRILTSAGRAHFFKYNCHSTARDVVQTLENLGLLPSTDESPYGAIVSTKGFFHTENIDTLRPDDLLIDNGVQNNGVVFVTIACPTTTVFFVYRERSLPQLLNCTTTIDYLGPVFNRLTGQPDDLQPRFTYLDSDFHTTDLQPNVPVMQQLRDAARLIVTIDYPACDDSTLSPSPRPSPSPSRQPMAAWDSESDRNGQVPPNAIKLGDGTLLLQNPTRWSQEELAKHRRHP